MANPVSALGADAPAAFAPTIHPAQVAFAPEAPEGSSAYLQRFIELGQRTLPNLGERDAVVATMHQWLSSFQPTSEQITSDFCIYLECGFKLESQIEIVPARLGWISLRLRTIARFAGEIPTALRPRSRFAKLSAWLRGEGRHWDGYAVDAEISCRWKMPPAQPKPARLTTGVLGPEPAEFLDENGVYRPVPLLAHLRRMVEEECRMHLQTQDLNGFQLAPR